MSASSFGTANQAASPMLMCIGLQADCRTLLVQPEVIWVDNSTATAAQLHRLLPTLRWVKEDVTHMMRQIMRELPRGHPMIVRAWRMWQTHVVCFPGSDRTVALIGAGMPHIMP
jgi:hypothetical protein